MKGKRRLRGLRLPAVAAALWAASAMPAWAQSCNAVAIAREQLPERLNRFVLQGDSISQVSPIARSQLPAVVEFQDCGDGAHYALILERMYLVRQAEISAVVACFRLGASNRKILGTAGSGQARRCR